MNMKKLVSFLWLVLIHLCSLSVGSGGGDESRKGGIVSFAQDFMSTLGDSDAVQNVINAGMNAIKSAVVDEGVKLVKESGEAKRLLKTGLDVANAINSMASMTDDADDAESDCLFHCPANARGTPGRAFRRLDHVPTENGCGSYGFRFEDAAFPGFTTCCNIHDRCYDECGNAKKDCDSQFQACLRVECSELDVGGMSPSQAKGKAKECNAIKDGLVLAVISFGCDAFLDAQKNACVCV